MIISKVILNNFYCFEGINELTFGKGLNIVSAPNSGGKSQLFNAFYWTFFNTMYLDNVYSKKEWKTANNFIVCPDKFKYELTKGEKIESSVEITLIAEYHLNDEPKGELVTYIFYKKAIYEKNESSLLVLHKPELQISFVRNSETEFIPSHQHSFFLESIFPSSIRKFMWYQGETMDDLYDFNNPSTLKNAIKEISYFPLYDNMEKIVKASSASIDKKIEKELAAKHKLTSKQQILINNINTDSTKIEKKEFEVNELQKEIDNLQDDIADVEQQLKGYDKYRDIKQELTQLQSELQLTKERITDADVYLKETLINKWMLNGCETLIQASENNLYLINQEIQAFQKNNNPVPMSLPGPEYIEKMLADKICYICERSVVEPSVEYEALKRRLNDFENNSMHKILQDNYTDLNRARKRLTAELPEIKEEIEENNRKRDVLLKRLTTINKKIKTIYETSGQNNGTDITVGASTASQMLSKIQNFRNSIDTKKKKVYVLNNELHDLNHQLTLNKQERDKDLKNTDINLIESLAADYIKVFVKVIGKLRSVAYERLITEIQEESNRLYSLYLGGKPQGLIIIDKGVRIIDKITKETLSELNTAELVAQKLAVANAFLSLSEKKMNRSYPIVADAPTSDFDPENTYNLTLNIGESFEQIIIMSKDYGSFNELKRDELIKVAKIQKFYEFKSEKIDMRGNDSRANKRTRITTIK